MQSFLLCHVNSATPPVQRTRRRPRCAVLCNHMLYHSVHCAKTTQSEEKKRNSYTRVYIWFRTSIKTTECRYYPFQCNLYLWKCPITKIDNWNDDCSESATFCKVTYYDLYHCSYDIHCNDDVAIIMSRKQDHRSYALCDQRPNIRHMQKRFSIHFYRIDD